MEGSIRNWFKDIIASEEKKPLPVLSFPAIQLMGLGVREFITDADNTAKGMKLIADRVPSAAALSPMDLSVEAETFGCAVSFLDDEVPNIVSSVVHTEADADALVIPDPGSGRTGICIEACRKAVAAIDDRPVFAGTIGPFSLAGRLMDVSETMFYCYDEPDMVSKVVSKCTDYLIGVCEKYKAAGAAGVLMAEPLTGIMSPPLSCEFSHPYVKRIVDAVQTDDFAVIYHNCGNSVAKMADDIFTVGAMGYHFGNSATLREMLEKAPSDVLVLGNINPSLIMRGEPEDVKEAVRTLMAECGSYSNFCLSSGCDIPPMSSWDNIDAFFEAAAEYGSR